MAKPYELMTPAERLADRINKNRDIEQKLLKSGAGWSLPAIVAQLNKHHQRASYGAVAALFGVLPRGLMTGRARCHEYSWVVASTGTKRGRPTGYINEEIHPECLRQIAENKGTIIESEQELRDWLADRTR